MSGNGEAKAKEKRSGGGETLWVYAWSLVVWLHKPPVGREPGTRIVIGALHISSFSLAFTFCITCRTEAYILLYI